MAAPVERELASVLALQLGWLLLAIGLAAWRGKPRERLGLVPSRLPWDASLGGVLGVLALSAGLDSLLGLLGLSGQGALAELDALASEAARRGTHALALLALGLAPGLAEELLFRGVLQRSLAARLGAGAIPAAAVLFAAAHQDPVQSPCAFALGAYLGALAYLARSSWIAIAGHCANNLLAVAAGQLGSAELASGPASALGFALAGLALAHAARRVRPARAG